MKERFRQFRETLGHIGARSVALALVVLLITAGIATYAGVWLYETEKQILLQKGELNAKESAAEYNRYLLTRVNVVTSVGYTVDSLLASGTDNSRVEQYLTEQTDYIIATIDPESTGLYGWINGEYLDGAGWVPDEDYVATERPWYIETIRSAQDITFVEPYLDLQTNTVMMTVSDKLKDGQSVLAMDVRLDSIQQIVKQVSSSSEGSQAFVLDASGIVVAHPDESQLGRNYLAEEDSLGGAVARKILKEGQRQFDLKTAEGAYSVYVEKLEGGWYSVSLIDATVWYKPLEHRMIMFAFILTLIVLAIILVLLRLNAKNYALEKLHMRIDEEEKRGEELQALTETDRMTGLYDHVSGERKVRELLASGCGGMFLELDIDRFKSINDTYGHQTGDLVILAVADVLRSTFRSNDITMRLGGDEFGVFAVGIVNREMGEAIIHRLFTQLSRKEVPELQGKEVSVSVGAVLCAEGEGISFEDLYSRADSAMYASKEIPGNSLTFSET